MRGVETYCVETPHGDGSGNPDYRNQRAERDPKPAKAPMPLRQGGMNKVVAYGETKALHDHRNNQE
jgi:hypothetical protein